MDKYIFNYYEKKYIKRLNCDILASYDKYYLSSKIVLNNIWINKHENHKRKNMYTKKNYSRPIKVTYSDKDPNTCCV